MINFDLEKDSNKKPIKERSPTDNFIILGCDGIFDVLNSTQLLQMTFGKWYFYILKHFKDFPLTHVPLSIRPGRSLSEEPPGKIEGPGDVMNPVVSIIA